LEWCLVKGQPGTSHNRAAVLREFCKYLQSIGLFDTYILPKRYVPKLHRHIPYFFTDDELYLFLEECDKISIFKEKRGRHLVIPTLFRLLCCCGLRCSEARNLKRCDVHLSDGFLDIIESKGPVSRRVYISDELRTVLENYDRAISEYFSEPVYYFPRTELDGYSALFISNNFNKLWLKAFPTFSSPVKPRAYDLRHRFAYENINRWTQEGIDINTMLTYLMRAMGHKNISSTMYYMHLTPGFYKVLEEKTDALQLLLPALEADDDI
jgi:integrase